MPVDAAVAGSSPACCRWRRPLCRLFLAALAAALRSACSSSAAISAAAAASASAAAAAAAWASAGSTGCCCACCACCACRRPSSRCRAAARVSMLTHAAPRCRAKAAGRTPKLPGLFRSAPAASRASVHSSHPRLTASCSGVLRSGDMVSASKSAPAAASNPMASAHPCPTAKWMGRSPTLFRTAVLAPASSSSRTVFGRRCATAPCSAL